MAHDHVGIPRFIERGFSINDRTYVYNIEKHKIYQTNVDRLGTRNDYYEEYVEKEILKKFEDEFSTFYNEYTKITDSNSLVVLLNQNKSIVEKYMSFMYFRSKKVLDDINKYSRSSKIFGELSHSSLLEINSEININPISILGDEYKILPVKNDSKLNFINNSIGYSIIAFAKKHIIFFIPLNSKLGIAITSIDKYLENSCLFIESSDDYTVNEINKATCRTEYEIGNGFIFGLDRQDVCQYKSFLDTAYKNE